MIFSGIRICHDFYLWNLNKSEKSSTFRRFPEKPCFFDIKKQGFFLSRANFKIISFATYNNDVDIGIGFQFFSKF